MPVDYHSKPESHIKIRISKRKAMNLLGIQWILLNEHFKEKKVWILEGDRNAVENELKTIIGQSYRNDWIEKAIFLGIAKYLEI